MTSKIRGFTLIELLVVVAIISLLSSVVFASLSSARNKGADATIQQQLKNISSEVELVYGDTNYSNVCSNTKIQSMIDVAEKASGVNENDRCYADSNEWVIAILLKSDPNYRWCVDYKGASLKVLVAVKQFVNQPADGNQDCD